MGTLWGSFRDIDSTAIAIGLRNTCVRQNDKEREGMLLVAITVPPARHLPTRGGCIAAVPPIPTCHGIGVARILA